MIKLINWKPYVIGITIVSMVVAVFNWKIAVGMIVSLGVYFLNLFLSEKKFPRLDSTKKAVSTAFVVIFLEGIIICAMAVILYFTCGLYSSLAAFGINIISNIYFMIMGSKK